MRKLVAGTFLTLDGVMQAPGGPEEDQSGGFRHGGWLVPYFDETLVEVMTDWVERAGGFLFGRKTYEIFAASWPKSTDPADRIAMALNTRLRARRRSPVRRSRGRSGDRDLRMTFAMDRGNW